MRAQLTRVELLARRTGEWLPDLLELIEKVYPEPGYIERLQEFIEARSGERVGLSTISSFVQKRYVQPRFTTRRILQILEDLEKKLGNEFTSDQARAVLHAAVTESVNAGKQVSLEFGLKETRLWDQQRLKARELEFELAKVKQERECERAAITGVVKQAEAAAREGRAFDPAEALKKISEVIGVGATLEERIENSEL